jgi:hypothetical protein
VNSEVHTWFADYAVHLDAGTAALTACTNPDAAWLQRCQEFDDQLRSFGGDAIGHASSVGPGPELVSRLRAARARFETASSEHVVRLQSQMDATAQGRKGLRGYGEAGRRMTDGSSLYLERRY